MNPLKTAYMNNKASNQNRMHIMSVVPEAGIKGRYK